MRYEFISWKLDTIDELENAIYDTNILTADAIKRILSQQKEGIVYTLMIVYYRLKVSFTVFL